MSYADTEALKVKRKMKTKFGEIYTTFLSVRHLNFPSEIRLEYLGKGIFEKGYTPKWTEEIFTISKIQYTDPITYKITDHNGEEIKGSFYERELQKTTQETFRIEKIISCLLYTSPSPRD